MAKISKETFKNWCGEVGPEVANLLVAEYLLTWNKSKIEKKYKLNNVDWNWDSGNYVNFCLYTTGYTCFVPEVCLNWFREIMPEKEGTFRISVKEVEPMANKK